MNLINSSHEIRPLLVMQVPNEKGTMMNLCLQESPCLQ